MRDMIFENASYHNLPGRNTIRVGNKWVKHLELGEVIRATRKNGDLIGELTVRGLAFVPLKDALRHFATNNHAVWDSYLETSPVRAAEFLKRELQKMYLDVVLDDTTPVSIVTFEDLMHYATGTSDLDANNYVDSSQV